MTFRDIEILDFDANGIEQVADHENMVHVPYILSNKPPEEWTQCFLSKAAYRKARIVGDRVIYLCRKDKAAINRNGECWNIVAKYIEYANRHYREIDAQQQQRRVREEEARRHEEEKNIKFEEWKRDLTR